jgi:zinc transport system ATP-binding protein
MDVLEAKNLNFSYDSKVILKDLNFSIQAGECIGIIGPNGGGKSTLLKLLTAELKASSGSLRIFSQSPEKSRNNIAYVPQNFHCDKNFPISVYELVMTGLLTELNFWGRFPKKAYEKADKIINELNIDHIKDKAIASLSGGQLQRALIARALVSEPKILLLDEPTSNLDIERHKEVNSIIKRLKGQITQIMVTHDLEESLELFDRVFLLKTDLQILPPEKLCEHYVIGLYHKPLIDKEHKC